MYNYIYNEVGLIHISLRYFFMFIFLLVDIFLFLKKNCANTYLTYSMTTRKLLEIIFITSLYFYRFFYIFCSRIILYS